MCFLHNSFPHEFLKFLYLNYAPKRYFLLNELCCCLVITFELMLAFFGTEHMAIAKCNECIGCFAAQLPLCRRQTRNSAANYWWRKTAYDSEITNGNILFCCFFAFIYKFQYLALIFCFWFCHLFIPFFLTFFFVHFIQFFLFISFHWFVFRTNNFIGQLNIGNSIIYVVCVSHFEFIRYCRVFL